MRYCGGEKRFFPDDEFEETESGTLHVTATGRHNRWGNEFTAKGPKMLVIRPATADEEMGKLNLKDLPSKTLTDIGVKGRF